MNSLPLALKYLSPELYTTLKKVVSQSGFSIDDVIRSGKENSDSSIGAYAADAESYAVFSPLFDPIIHDYHGITKGNNHKTDLNTGSLGQDNIVPTAKKVISTRIRVARNFADFSFPTAISRKERLEVERLAIEIFESLEGDLSGEYHSLATMNEETRTQLVEEHFLFKKGDRFLESAGVNRDWPEGRGIFFSDDKKFLIWVNEEDHLRIISMQQGGDINAVFERLTRAISAIESRLKFAYSNQYGYLTSCPTNLGTAMRASVHIDLSSICGTKNFTDICTNLGLSVRGIDGEHSDDDSGIFDISNKQRLGITEIKTVNLLKNGISKLIAAMPPEDT